LDNLLEERRAQRLSQIEGPSVDDSGKKNSAAASVHALETSE
jgi:hypothetical protein